MIPRAPIYVLILASLSLVSAKPTDSDGCPNPYIDPANDSCNPIRYIPDKAVNIVAAVLYFIVAIILTWQNYRHRANYMLCLVIGAYCEGIGIVLRLAFRNNPHSQAIYILQYLFVVLSPCAFLAGDYILLGRLVAHLDAPQYLRPFKAKAISWTFITSDIVTFLIQAAGGGLSISKQVPTAAAGGHVFLAGIAAQMASFLLFSSLWAMFAIRAYAQDKVLWRKTGWKPLHWALGFTCICFLIRSVYRTVELSQGYIGYLATHERYFLGLDTLPLWLGICSYTFIWPGKYITPESRIIKESPSAETQVVSPVPRGDVESGGPVEEKDVVNVPINR